MPNSIFSTKGNNDKLLAEDEKEAENVIKIPPTATEMKQAVHVLGLYV